MVAGDEGHGADAVIGRASVLSPWWQNTRMSNADAILGERFSDVMSSEATSFVALPRVDVQLVVRVYDGARH